MRDRKVLVLLLCGLLPILGSGLRSDPAESELISLYIPGSTWHNRQYFTAAFLYHLQTILGATAKSPNVMQGEIVQRKGKDLYLDLGKIPAGKVGLFRQIAAQKAPAGEMSLDEVQAYLQTHYYELTGPYATLQALLHDHPYRNNPDWLTVPVDSATFFRRRVLRINKDRVADALTAYFDHHDRLIYPEGTIIVAESLDKAGNFIDAEVLRKRGDTFWNFAVYDKEGRLANKALAFNEDGDPEYDQKGFVVPNSCALCHRIDRLDLSGDPDSPVVSPVRGFFHRLPARVPQIHLGPEYYDHMAFTELTEANAKVKDGVFGVYGSLLLSELAGRKRLGQLTNHDVARYRRLQSYYSELLTILDRVDFVINSLGMQLLRIFASK